MKGDLPGFGIWKDRTETDNQLLGLSELNPEIIYENLSGATYWNQTDKEQQ